MKSIKYKNKRTKNDDALKFKKSLLKIKTFNKKKTEKYSIILFDYEGIIMTTTKELFDILQNR